MATPSPAELTPTTRRDLRAWIEEHNPTTVTLSTAQILGLLDEVDEFALAAAEWSARARVLEDLSCELAGQVPPSDEFSRLTRALADLGVDLVLPPRWQERVWRGVLAGDGNLDEDNPP